MKTNKFLGLAAIGIAALSVNPAQAGGVHVSLGLPLPPIPFVSVCAPRVVCAPPPVVYAPAPVVYAPPVYYAAPWGPRSYGYSHYTYGRYGLGTSAVSRAQAALLSGSRRRQPSNDNSFSPAGKSGCL